MLKLTHTLKKYSSHLIALLIFAAVTYAYMPPVLSGKVLQQEDVTNSKGSTTETEVYYEKEGNTPLWTNAIFGGMPTYQISMKGHENPVKMLMKPAFHQPFNKLFISLVCSYLMFLAFGARSWLSIIGAFAFTYTTGNLIILDAGHNTKMQAISYAPLVIAGLKFLLSKRYLLGANIFALGMSLQLISNHVQITFYLGIFIAFWMLAELIIHIKQREIKPLFKVASIVLAGLAIALTISSQNLMLTKEYSESTIRGKSDLTVAQAGSEIKEKEKKSSGLDYEYAFQWSNGWQDIATIIIPNFAGSGGTVNLGSGSPFERKLPKQAIENFPFAYWGELPFTAGPIYFGSSIFLLFILALVFTRGPLKWWILAAFILSIMLSMGKNYFVGFNSFLFEHLPLYNKFRVPSIALTLAQWCMPLLAIVGLSRFLRSEEKPKLQSSLKITGISVGAILIILTFFSGIFSDHSHQIVDPSTNKVLKDFDKDVYAQYKIEPHLLKETRADLIQSDGLRSIFFAALVLGLLWLYTIGKLSNRNVILGIGFIILIDLWGIDKRYLNDDDFAKPRVANSTPSPSQVDQIIMQDTSYYRVLDMRKPNIMSSSDAALFHKSVGGYHPAKLRRYQELYDWYISRDLSNGNYGNSSVLNMLNTKYVIGKSQDGQETYMTNTNALGNAWFVSEVLTVKNADSCILALDRTNFKQSALVEQQNSKMGPKKYATDSSANITLASYHPEKLVYNSNNSEEGFAVFSEIYYNKGWKATINGEPANIENVNFVLRGLELPKGQNEIVFEFKPQSYALSRAIMLGGNAVLYLLLGVSLFIWLKKEFLTKDEVAKT